MTPILPGPKAITEEMSSAATEVPLTAGTNGVPQVRSLPIVRLTQTWPPCVQVAHSFPVPSFSTTSVSVR